MGVIEGLDQRTAPGDLNFQQPVLGIPAEDAIGTRRGRQRVGGGVAVEVIFRF